MQNAHLAVNDPMAVNDLYLLVKSLDKAERDRVQANAKRANKDGSMVYMALFDDLLAAKQYSADKAFLKVHAGASYEKSFPQMKVYLYEFILDALRSHRRRAGVEKPMDFQVRESIEAAHLLRSKLLFGQSLHQLEKALGLAEECQYYELLLESLKLVRTQLNEHAEKDKTVELHAILARIGEVGALIHLNCQLLILREELFGYVRRNANPDKDLKAKLSEKLDDLAALQALDTASIEAKTNHHLCHALYDWIKGDLTRAWEHHHAVYLLWRGAALFARERNVQHIKLLSNFLTTSIAAGKTEDFIEALDFLEKQSGPTPDARAESIQNTAYIRLQYFLSKGEWENALQIEAAFNRKPAWVTLKTHRPRLQIFYMSFARLYFVLGMYKEAGKYLGRFDEERIANLHDDKWSEAIVLRVLVSFSDLREGNQANGRQKEMDILNEIRAARRALKQLPNTSEFLDLLLLGLKGVSNLDAVQQPAAWRKLLTKIKKTEGLVRYDSARDLILGWVQSQAEGKPLAAILAAD